MERGLVSLLNADIVTPDRHVVCTMRDPGPLSHALHEAIRVESLGINRSDPLAAFRLARIIRAVRPDIIHARNFNTWTDTRIATKLACRSRMTTIYGFHGLEDHNGFSSRQQRRAKQFKFNRVQFTAVSNAGKRQLSRELNVPQNQVTILRNGVDTQKFAPANDPSKKAVRTRLGIPRDAFVITTVASIVPVKDHITMLNAVTKAQSPHDRFVWIVVGDGSERSNLSAAIDNLDNPPNVIFTGNQHDVLPFLHAADIFLLASKYEQMSIALLEAMSTELPAVVTNVGDHATIVRHNSDGYVTEPSDTNNLATAIRMLATDTNTRTRLSRSARKRVINEFSFESAARQYVSFYEKLVQSPTETPTSCAASPASSQITV